MSEDPIHLDLDSPIELQGSPRRILHSPSPSAGQTMSQDPFYVPPMERPRNNNNPYTIDADRQYGSRTVMTEIYSSSLVGPSMASLIGQHRGHFEHETEVDDGHREDDEAHLTANMSHAGMGSGSSEGFNGDPENEGATTPTSRRRTLRYSVSPSPLKKTETAMKTVSRSLRRMSLRVVNLANTGLEGQLRLRDVDDKKSTKQNGDDDDDSSDDEGPPRRDLTQALPLRGRTLGFLGPESRVRRTLFNFLVYPYVSKYLSANASLTVTSGTLNLESCF